MSVGRCSTVSRRLNIARSFLIIKKMFWRHDSSLRLIRSSVWLSNKGNFMRKMVSSTLSRHIKHVIVRLRRRFGLNKYRTKFQTKNTLTKILTDLWKIRISRENIKIRLILFSKWIRWIKIWKTWVEIWTTFIKKQMKLKAYFKICYKLLPKIIILILKKQLVKNMI